MSSMSLGAIVVLLLCLLSLQGHNTPHTLIMGAPLRHTHTPKESATHAPYPLKEIKDCVELAMQGRRFMKKTEKALHLDFGDPTIEMFNVLSTHDIKQIEALEFCVRHHAPEMFVDRQGLPHRNYTHGGSNITFLTGAFQQVLPDILEKIVACAQEPMLEARDASFWFSPIRGLGVRSVQFLSFVNIKPKLTKEKRREIRYAKFLEAKNDVVWIGKPQPDIQFVEDEDIEDEAEEWFDEHADENLVPYMSHEQNDQDSLYLTTVLLSDRYHFSGGEMYIKRDKVGKEEALAAAAAAAAASGDDSEENDGYEDENEDVGEVIPETLVGILERKKKRLFPVYNARTSTIGRYTPEKGSVLLMRGDYPRGMGALHRGKRLCLVVEFWPYADSVIGATRPTAKEALPLPQRWEL